MSALFLTALIFFVLGIIVGRGSQVPQAGDNGDGLEGGDPRITELLTTFGEREVDFARRGNIVPWSRAYPCAGSERRGGGFSGHLSVSTDSHHGESADNR